MKPPGLTSCRLLSPLAIGQPGEVFGGRCSVSRERRLTGLVSIYPPVLLEHLQTAEEYDRARAHVMSVAQQAGVDLEN